MVFMVLGSLKNGVGCWDGSDLIWVKTAGGGQPENGRAVAGVPRGCFSGCTMRWRDCLLYSAEAA
ncbi:hypothetical protein [Kingella oralis]